MTKKGFQIECFKPSNEIVCEQVAKIYPGMHFAPGKTNQSADLRERLSRQSAAPGSRVELRNAKLTTDLGHLGLLVVLFNGDVD